MATATTKTVPMSTIKISNTLSAVDGKVVVWNTGAAALGHPHGGEDPANAGKAILEVNANPSYLAALHILAVHIFRSNQEWLLQPGDSVTITAQTSDEILYYTAMNGQGGLKVEVTDPVKS